MQIVFVTLHRDLRELTEDRPSWWHRLTTRVDCQVGGVQVHTDAILRLCEEQGDPTALVTPFDGSWIPPAFASALAKLLDTRWPGLAERWRTRWHTQLLRRALRRRSDLLGQTPLVVYAQSPRAAAAVRAEWPPDVPVVVAHHGSNVSLPLPPGFHEHPDPGLLLWGVPPALRTAYETVQGLVFVSKFIADAVLTHAAVSPSADVAVIPNFLPDSFRRDAVAVPSLMGRDIITTGRLSSEKNIGFLLEVVAAARQKGRDITATVVGSGYQHDELTETAHRLGIDDLVLFTGQRTDIANLLAAHRLYFHPSTMESFGYSVIEAMGIGLPVAVAPIGGVPEIVSDDVEGIYLSLDDAERSATDLIDLLDDEPRARRMGEAGYAKVSARYTVASAGEQLRDFLESHAGPVAPGPKPLDWIRPPRSGGDDRLTVGMATFDRAHYLRSALESIRSQDAGDFAIRVVDDASTDATPALLAEIDDPRLAYARQHSNRGWLENCNAVLRGVNSTYVTLLGDDDIMLDGALLRSMDFLDAHPECAFVHGSFNVIGPDDEIVMADTNLTQDLVSDTIESGELFISKCMRLGNRVISQTVMIRSDLLPEVPFEPADGPVADFTLWLTLATMGDVGFLATPSVNYRVHDGSDSARWGRTKQGGYAMGPAIIRRQLEGKRRFIDRHQDNLENPGGLRRSATIAAARLFASWLIGPRGRAAARFARDTLRPGRRR